MSRNIKILEWFLSDLRWFFTVELVMCVCCNEFYFTFNYQR